MIESSSVTLHKGSLCYSESSFHWNPQANLTNITQIACGANHSLALTEEGSVFIWGQNEAGQIPNSTAQFVDSPLQLPFSNCVEIACHDNYSCVLTKEGLFYWPYYRMHMRISNPARVNTLCYLNLKIIQIGCHDGFNTFLTEQGQLFGYYYYISKNKALSPAARFLFPQTLPPGHIHALLPNCV